MIVNVDAKSLDIDKVSWQGKTIRSRFEHKIKVLDNGCWFWLGAKRSHNNCGALKISQQATISAHRLSYAMYVGDVPPNMCVLHKCDNPLCVNPEHLFLGTQLENIKDRDMKGRQRNKSSAKNLGYIRVEKEGRL